MVTRIDCLILGDSAGGGLTAALTCYLRDINEDFPAAICPLTPWIDLTCDAPCDIIGEEFTADVISRDMLLHNAYAYTAGYHGTTNNGLIYKHPLVSPVLDLDTKGKPWVSADSLDY